ncbi:MAG: hypothetical protein LWX07_01015 [Bacteroidetes bacterium]|nr:hypothetical protein [Bacteroidota bacterium]
MILRKILLALIIFAGANLYSQVIPEDFTLGKFKDVKNPSVKKSLKTTFYTAAPKSSKCPISNFITDIFNAGDTVWFGTGSGIMRTTDHFGSFDYYIGTEPFGNDDVAGFVIKNNVYVVGTAITEELNGESVATGTGIKVSTDYGVTWNSYPQPMDGRYDTVIVYGSNNVAALPVVVPQQNLSYDIAVTKKMGDSLNYTIWITSFAGGLRKSTDYGATWQRVLLPPDDLDSIYIGGTYNFKLNPNDNYNHRLFSVCAVNDSTLLAGSADGINVSRDWGISWRKYKYQNSGVGTNRVSGNFVVKFHVQKYGTKEIWWAATRKANDLNEVDAVSYSTNHGYSWSYSLAGYRPNGISSRDSVVYAYTDGGLWRANFGKFDWSKPSLIADPVSKDICKSNSFYTGNFINDTLYFGSADGLLRIRETVSPWTSPWKIFRACGDITSTSTTYAAPNPFSPNNEVTRFFYKTSKPSSKVTIKIFDFGMNPVRTLIQNAVRTNTDVNFAIWDGKNDDGYVAANAVYFYRIEVDDDTPLWGKVILMK